MKVHCKDEGIVVSHASASAWLSSIGAAGVLTWLGVQATVDRTCLAMGMYEFDLRAPREY